MKNQKINRFLYDLPLLPFQKGNIGIYFLIFPQNATLHTNTDLVTIFNYEQPQLPWPLPRNSAGLPQVGQSSS